MSLEAIGALVLVPVPLGGLQAVRGAGICGPSVSLWDSIGQTGPNVEAAAG